MHASGPLNTISEDLKPFRRAAGTIEALRLGYTILRPACLTGEDEVDYELTGRNEPFKGTVVSRRCVVRVWESTSRALTGTSRISSERMWRAYALVRRSDTWGDRTGPTRRHHASPRDR